MSVEPVFDPYIVKISTYSDGQAIIEEGSMGSWIYVILEGSVRVKKRTARRMVTVDTLKQGEVFGEMVFLEGGEGARSASVIAAEGSVRVGLLDTEKLVNEYEAVPAELRAIIRSFMTKLRNTTSKVCSILAAG